MSCFYVKKINQSFLQIACDDYGYLKILKDKFSFKSPGSQFDRRVRAGLWDGRISLINLQKYTAPVGLYQEIREFCKEYDLEFVDQTEPILKDTPDDISNFDQFVAKLNLPFQPRDYQIDSVKQALCQNKTLILSPTGCHAKGTKIITDDLSLKNVEDIREGDRLKGINQPRTVLKTIRNVGKLFLIQPHTSPSSQALIVNNEHILPLIDIDTNKRIFLEVDKIIDYRKYRLIKHENGIETLLRFTIIDLHREGEYFGFVLDGDHLYYTSDHILHHNSGKSLSIYILARWMLHHQRKVCLIVPNTNLVEQMINDFKEYSVNDDSFDVTKDVKGLYSKRKTDPFQCNFLISTWQSICRYDKSLYQSWDCVIIDEVHRCVANNLKMIVEGSINSRFKIGMTGSLSGENLHQYMLTGLFGNPYIATTTKQLQQKGQLSDMRLLMVIIKYPQEEAKTLWKQAKQLKAAAYQEEVKFLNNHVKRQLFIRNLACACKGTTMVLFRYREQGEALYQLIKEKCGNTRSVFYIDGTVDPKDREAIRQACISENGAILVSSVNTTGAGLNIPKIENLILCPGKGRIQTIQSIGRSLRLAKNKSFATVYDIVDDLTVGRHHNYFQKFGSVRWETYQEQGFDVAFKTVNF